VPLRDVDAVLLDVGGVFLLPSPEVMLPPLAQVGVHPDVATLDRAHYAAAAALDRVYGPDHAGMWDVYRRTYARRCGVPEDRVPEAANALGRAFSGTSWQRLVPGTVPALRALAATGVALGIVSNASGTIAEMLLAARVCQEGEGAGVPVTVIVDSHRVGVEKPDPRIFRIALDRLGVDPGRAVHVGDTLHADVAGAVAAGVRPVHLDPYGDCPQPDNGHVHVRALGELPALLAG
jgi:putative hydrolase of the HAD superfamily